MVGGGLPTPHRARWQPLRAGAVNLWEFEVAEYWFSDGRAQLKGRNESGKSTLMALTTLILLAGDTSPHLIDTLGTQNKRFRYYVEPENDDEDRRDASKWTNRGWAWIEYGRQGDHGPSFVTALLYADQRRAKESPQLTWVICDGTARVRAGIDLARHGRTIVPPADASDDPRWRPHLSGQSYQKHLATALFNSDASRLDDYVRMLKVIRTPKLGAKLNTEFLRRMMREALPPLAENEVKQLADGWEQLERIAADRDSAEEARQAVASFVETSWRPWATSVVRRASDRLTSAVSDVDLVTRTAREAEGVLAQVTCELADVLSGIESVTKERDASVVDRDELQESERHQEAVAAAGRAQMLAEQARMLRTTADERAVEASTAAKNAARFEKIAEDRGHKAITASTNVTDQVDALSILLSKAGPPSWQLWNRNEDFQRVSTAIDQRTEHVDHLLGLARTVASRTRTAETRAEELDKAQTFQATTKGQRDDTLLEAQTAAQSLVDRISAWAARLDPPPSNALLLRWTECADRIIAEAHPAPLLAQTAAADYFLPRRTELSTSRAIEVENAARSQREAETIEAQINELKGSPAPAIPEPALWQRRVRSPGVTSDGAPLWSLLEPLTGTDSRVVDVLESALAASGLLEMWVNADGTWRMERDGNESILSAAFPAVENPLSTVLSVVPEAADQIRVSVERILNGITWHADEAEPQGPIGLSAEGHWLTPIGSGRASPPVGGATLLGATARKRGIDRQIEILERDRQSHRDDRETAQGVIVTIDHELLFLDGVEQSLPDDRALAGLVRSARDLEDKLETAVAAADEASRRLREANADLDDARGAAAAFAADRALPIADEELTGVQRALVACRGPLQQAIAAVEAREVATATAAEADINAESARSASDEAQSRASGALKDADEADLRAKTAQRVISGEILDVLAAVEELKETVKSLEAELAGLAEFRTELRVKERTAELKLEERAAAADSAREARDQASAEWWTLIDIGLPAELGLPRLEVRTLTAGIDHARYARANLRPANWPDRDPEAQRRRVDGAWSRLVNDTTALRGSLELNAGRTVRIVDPVDDDDLARLEIVVDGTGEGHAPPKAVLKLTEQHSELREAYDENMHRTLHELLGSTFIEHLRERLEGVASLHRRINNVLAAHPTGTTRTTLRVKRTPVEGDPHAANVLGHLEEASYRLMTDEVQAEVRRFLQIRIDEARSQAQQAGEVDWRRRLGEALDYRQWFDTTIEKRAGDSKSWSQLTTGSHGRLSGGASVVTLMLPLIATLAAMYEATPDGPRPLWLDEAFDGVDAFNRASVLDLLSKFDLDYLLAGPGLLVNVASVESAAIWDVLRAPHPEPGVSLELSLWAGSTLEIIDVPDAALVAARPSNQMSLLAHESESPELR